MKIERVLSKVKSRRYIIITKFTWFQMTYLTWFRGFEARSEVHNVESTIKVNNRPVVVNFVESTPFLFKPSERRINIDDS